MVYIDCQVCRTPIVPGRGLKVCPACRDRITPRSPDCKLRELEDFADPDVRALIREAYAKLAAQYGSAFPTEASGASTGRLRLACAPSATLALSALRASCLALVRAPRRRCSGSPEPRRARRRDRSVWRRVGGAGACGDAHRSGRYATCAWNPARLTVERMDALNLRYADASFDGVFSAGSIEHFGDYADVRQALAEMHRVLRPRGIAALSTEYRLEGELHELPGILLFDESELRGLFDPELWQLVEPLDLRISATTLASVVDFERVTDDIMAGREWRFPHIVLHHSAGVTWTSVHVALRKL